MEKAIIPAKNYFCYSEKTTLKTMNEVAAREVDSLMAEAFRLGLEVSGPLEFIYLDASGDLDKPFSLIIALPVKESKAVENGKYSFQSYESIKCMQHTHLGSITNIHSVYDKLFNEIYSNGIKPTNQVREVYHKFIDMESPENITEIQIGIL